MKKNVLALATIAVALTATSPISAEVISAIAKQYGVDAKSMQTIADEVLAAKTVAEADMQAMFNQETR